MSADEVTHGADADASRVRTGPRHAAPRKPLLTRMHLPHGEGDRPGGDADGRPHGHGLHADARPRRRAADLEEPHGRGVPGLRRRDDGRRVRLGLAVRLPSETSSDTKDDSSSDSKDTTSQDTTSKDSGSGSGGSSSSDSGSGDTAEPSPSASSAASSTDTAASSSDDTATASPSATETSKNVLETIGDAIKDVFDGDGTDDTTATASPSPSATASASTGDSGSDTSSGSSGTTKDTPEKTAETAKNAVSDAADSAADTATQAAEDTADASAGASPSPSASATTDVDDCPVATDEESGVDNKLPLPDDPWYLNASSLLLKGADYQGIVKVKTSGGKTKQVLKYVISGGTEIGDLHQTVIDKQAGKTYHVQAGSGTKSTIENGDTVMYTESISGNLFGLIPVTFTPENPPPLNIPLIYFTNVKVQQAYQFGGTLTVPGLHQYIT